MSHAHSKTKVSKYKNVKTEINGIKFDSKKEAEYFEKVLKPRLDSGELREVKCHPTYVLQEPFVDREGKKHRAITYEADFEFVEDGKKVVVDVKGVLTEVYKIKLKLFLRNLPENTIFREVK